MKISSPLRFLAFSLFQGRNGMEKLLAGLGYSLYGKAPGKVSLEGGEVIRLRKGSGVQRLRVRQGVVWLTRTPADGDILLKAGEQVDLDHGWPIVVQALDEAWVDVWR